jgi:two-component system KDP operon response regulator KdpE
MNGAERHNAAPAECPRGAAAPARLAPESAARRSRVPAFLKERSYLSEREERVINVLIIEDEHAIRRFLRTALEADGMRVFEADTLQRGLIEAATRKPDVVILDLGLPDGDGNEFIRDVRQWSQMPIIVLSARTEEHDKIAALDAGADDYLSKPFGIGELQARLRVAMRRHAGAQADEPLVRFADIEVDIPARRIVRGDEELHLTPIEFRLLVVLLNNPGKVLTQRQLLNQVWGPNAVEHSHYLRIYMGHLRQKLEADPARPQHLLTETGIGYRFMP